MRANLKWPIGMEGMAEAFELRRREEFATAIALPGTLAVLITGENKGDGRPIPIAEAVSTGHAFSVQLAPHVLAFDADSPIAALAALVLTEEFKARDFPFVLLGSGRPGHYHLLLAVHDGQLRSELTARAHAVGLRPATSLRPPLTPHRSGLSMQLLWPDSEEAALRALAPRPRRRLTPRLERLLREGDTSGRYRKDNGETDDSGVLAALVTSYIQRGWSLDQASRQLLKRANRGGTKLQEIKDRRGPHAAFRYLRGLWREQVRLIRHSPPSSTLPIPTRERLDHLILHAALTLPWNTRGHSLWALLVAMVLVASEAGSDLDFEASTRQLAEQAGLSRRTVRKCLQGRNGDLLARGWVIRVRRGIGTRGSVWRLQLPSAAVAAFPSNPGRLAPLGGALGLLGNAVIPDHDALRWRIRRKGGLGKGVPRLVVILACHRPIATDELLTVCNGIKPHQVRRLAGKLRAAGLIGEGARLQLVPDVRRRLDEAAWRLRAYGTGARQRQVHEHERERYREGYARRVHEYQRERDRRRQRIRRTTNTPRRRRRGTPPQP
jgi:hypothetical protein